MAEVSPHNGGHTAAPQGVVSLWSALGVAALLGRRGEERTRAAIAAAVRQIVAAPGETRSLVDAVVAAFVADVSVMARGVSGATVCGDCMVRVGAWSGGRRPNSDLMGTAAVPRGYSDGYRSGCVAAL
eukprot:TRINITY_DN70723_c0_g1_i1.p1 TRINITY_DN70723_c0_g1~~TRINITY_DN70723_c0_g1_i1.p1  ORF type:complete len:128 (-),score=9.02 TRINITY_DN70723_c0_g1_i1:7-390(-)